MQRLVNISQVVTETDLVSRSNQLENALTTNQFAEFCNLKISNSKDDTEESIWNFMKVGVTLLFFKSLWTFEVEMKKTYQS